MKIKFSKVFLALLLILVILFLVINVFKSFKAAKATDIVKIVLPEEKVGNAHFIVSEELILKKLQSKAQIVSVQQEIDKTYTDVNEYWSGDRHTTMNIKGIYMMGLDTADIQVKHVDSNAGILYIKLGDPKLIALEIAYHDVEFKKTKGFLRGKMNEKERNEFYKSIEKDIRSELLSDEEILKQANLYNQEAIKELLRDLAGVKHISFE